MNHVIPELKALLDAVEQKYGAPVKTTVNFERLSATIENALGEPLSSTTLKRLWGYVPSLTTPRLSTLDVLARYAGHKDFHSFCRSLHAEDSSLFLNGAGILISAELSAGEKVRIGWAPNRLVTLKYLGGDRFEVLSQANSKLREGDIFEVSCFLKECPLYIPAIIRGGETTLPYVAGQVHGLTTLEKI